MIPCLLLVMHVLNHFQERNNTNTFIFVTTLNDKILFSVWLQLWYLRADNNIFRVSMFSFICFIDISTGNFLFIIMLLWFGFCFIIYHYHYAVLSSYILFLICTPHQHHLHKNYIKLIQITCLYFVGG